MCMCMDVCASMYGGMCRYVQQCSVKYATQDNMWKIQ